MKGPTVHSEVHLKPSSWIYIYCTSLKITYPFHPGFWKPLQGRSLLQVSKGVFCLLNKMLCRHCTVQNTPAEHQNENEVLDRMWQGGRGAVRQDSSSSYKSCFWWILPQLWVQSIHLYASQSASNLFYSIAEDICIGQILTHLCSSLIAECCHSLNRT